MHEELKEKIAEFVGFERGKGIKTFKKEGGTLYTETNRWWRTPKVGKYWGEYEKLPDFPRSLDACFEWVVPKVGQFTYLDVFLHDWIDKFYTEEETPALALCYAVEKLIDVRVEV